MKIQSNKMLNVALGIIAIAIILAGGTLFALNNKPASTQILGTSAVDNVKAQLIVDNPNDNSTKQYEMETKEGESALDFMTRLKNSNVDFTFEKKDYSFGASIISINGYTANASKHEFWKFIVNGADSSVGVSEYKMKSGDKIKFKIDKY